LRIVNYLPIHRLRVYRNFKAIEADDFEEIVRYYERFEDGIQALDFEEYLDCTLAYTDALFEAGQHGKHLVMCDHLLETVIMQNLETWGGEDLYHQLLLKKSRTLYHLEDYPRSEHILREVIKIYPQDGLAAVFLNKCLLRQKPAWLARTRAASVGLVLLAAVVIAVEIFALPRFFPKMEKWVLVGHNVLLASGLAALAVGEAGHALRCWQRTRRAVRSALRQRAK
jgi:tetratricopeptide (TPR) repeat protein